MIGVVDFLKIFNALLTAIRLIKAARCIFSCELKGKNKENDILLIY